jgi:hypothetical protein
MELPRDVIGGANQWQGPFGLNALEGKVAHDGWVKFLKFLGGSHGRRRKQKWYFMKSRTRPKQRPVKNCRIPISFW